MWVEMGVALEKESVRTATPLVGEDSLEKFMNLTRFGIRTVWPTGSLFRAALPSCFFPVQDKQVRNQLFPPS
jgi:hypothetical protein